MVDPDPACHSNPSFGHLGWRKTWKIITTVSNNGGSRWPPVMLTTGGTTTSFDSGGLP